MTTTRRTFVGTLAAATLAARMPPAATKVTKFVRYRHGSGVSYGILEGETIRELRGNLFEKYSETGAKRKLSDVKLLYPCDPPKILAVGLNYKSHIGNRPAPKNPEMFYKPISALLEPEGNIVIPEGAKNVHYEGELVIVMGKKANNVSLQDAAAHIFGYTCGNDVS